MHTVQVRYSAPPSADVDEEPSSRRRVTRGRQVHYFDHLMLTEDEEEEEQDNEVWRKTGVFIFQSGILNTEKICDVHYCMLTYCVNLLYSLKITLLCVLHCEL